MTINQLMDSISRPRVSCESRHELTWLASCTFPDLFSRSINKWSHQQKYWAKYIWPGKLTWQRKIFHLPPSIFQDNSFFSHNDLYLFVFTYVQKGYFGKLRIKVEIWDISEGGGGWRPQAYRACQFGHFPRHWH